MRGVRSVLVAVFCLYAVVVCAGCVGGDRNVHEPEYVEIVVGDPTPGRSLPLIVGIHGLGDRPEMFARLFASEFPIAARLIFPRGPALEGQGFSWFPIPIASAIDGEAVADGVRVAGEGIAALIERLAREHSSDAKPVVFGYSQGGILSFYLAAQHPDLVAAVVPIAGFLPRSLLATTRPAPTYAFHGGSDELVPVAAARATIQAFTERGGAATLAEYPHVGHEITVAMMRAARQKVSDAVSPKS
jgi:phospholipase/carboxylesterase